MKPITEEDILIPCSICNGKPKIEWDGDEFSVSCNKCSLSIYRNCNDGVCEISTASYVLSQINMWNRAHDVNKAETESNCVIAICSNCPNEYAEKIKMRLSEGYRLHAEPGEHPHYKYTQFMRKKP